MATKRERQKITQGWFAEYENPKGVDTAPYLAAYTWRELHDERLGRLNYRDMLDLFVKDENEFQAFCTPR